MSTHVIARTDSGHAGWWCSLHEEFTGQKGWCYWCDESRSGTPSTPVVSLTLRDWAESFVWLCQNDAAERDIPFDPAAAEAAIKAALEQTL